MGKGEDASAEQPADESSDSKEEAVPEEPKPEETEETPAEAPAEPEPEVKEEPSEDEEKKKKDTEALQKVIKVDSGGGGDAPPPAAEEDDRSDLVEEDSSNDGSPASRESLEQKRAILQSIKDFDFQIKKNQEEISGVNQKLENMSKDLDDLVSLYEIVSEQMNPFVGLSKVTKKRLDALENFTREIDLLKERTGELESFAERSGAKIKNITEGEFHADTIDTEAILGKEGEEPEVKSEEEIAADISGEVSPEEVEKAVSDDANGETPAVEEPPVIDTETQEEISIEPLTTIHDTPVEDTGFGNLSDLDLDRILEKAFGIMSPEGKVDMVIDEFIESLKG